MKTRTFQETNPTNFPLISYLENQRGLSKEIIQESRATYQTNVHRVGTDCGPGVFWQLSNGTRTGRLTDPPQDEGKSHNIGPYSRLYHTLRDLDLSRPVCVVEGIIDELSLWDAGAQALATISAGHVPDYTTLKGLKLAVLMLDNDQAGRKNEEKHVRALQKLNIPVIALHFPQGDANDYLRAYGNAALKQFLDKAIATQAPLDLLPELPKKFKPQTPIRKNRNFSRGENWETIKPTMEEVCSYYGIEQTRKHQHCPFPGHLDKGPSFRYDGKGWICTCGNGDSYDLIAGMERLDSNSQFPEVCKIARKITGQPAWKPPDRSPQAQETSPIIQKLKDLEVYESHNDRYSVLKGGQWIIYHNNPQWAYNSTEDRSLPFSKVIWEAFEKYELDNIGKFYQNIQKPDFVLEGDQYISDLLDDGSLSLPSGHVHKIVATTGSGKGRIALHCVSQGEKVLMVDSLRTLVQQSHDRLSRQFGREAIAHYHYDASGKAANASALCICTPSVNLHNDATRFFLQKNDKFTVILDEAHLITLELFYSRKIYKDVLCVLQKANKVILLTGTSTKESNLFAERLAKNLEMPLKQTVVVKKKKKINAAVLTYKKPKEETNFVVDRLSNKDQSAIYISQSKAAVKRVQAGLLELDPEREMKVCTSETVDTLEPTDPLGLGSPTLATGKDINHKVDLLIVSFVEGIFRPESLEQTLSRIRNDNGLNDDCEILILVKEQEAREIPDYDLMLDSAQREQQQAIKATNDWFAGEGWDSEKPSPITSDKPFINYHADGTVSFDETYWRIKTEYEATKRFVQKVGCLNFIQYAMAHPEILSGVKINSIQSIEGYSGQHKEQVEKAVERKKAEEIIFNESRPGSGSFIDNEDKKGKLEELSMKRNREAHQEEIREHQVDIMKFKARVNGVDLSNKKQTESNVRKLTTVRRPLAILNTMLFFLIRLQMHHDVLKDLIKIKFSAGNSGLPLLGKLAVSLSERFTEEIDGDHFLQIIGNALKKMSNGEFKEAFGRAPTEQNLKEIQKEIIGLFGGKLKNGGREHRTLHAWEGNILLERGLNYALIFGVYDNFSISSARSNQEIEGILLLEKAEIEKVYSKIKLDAKALHLDQLEAIELIEGFYKNPPPEDPGSIYI